MMLSGCSTTSLVKKSEPGTRLSSTLLKATRPPLFNVKVWRDYPDYALQLKLALEKCNQDKALFYQMMSTHWVDAAVPLREDTGYVKRERRASPRN